MLRGNDIAGVNGPGAARQCLAGGAAFVIAKATEGLSWDDPDHDSFVAQVRAAGKKVGHYHYAWPEHDPIAEAKHFLARCGWKPGDLLMLDLERTKVPVSWGRRVAYALSWLAYVKRVTGASPVLYLNGEWIDGLRSAASAAQWSALTSYPLAYAHYSGKPGVFDSRIHEWPTWTIHQFTDSPLDGDAFNGDAAVWARLAVPARSGVAKKAAAAVAVAAVAAAGGVVAVHQPVPAPRPVVKAVPACPAPAKPVPPAKPVLVKPVPHKPVPVKPARVAVFYVVRSGDTLSLIAARFHTTVAALASANHISNINVIRAGQRLRVQ